MDSIGAEVGHKMRSAIKAKLLELDCYVDDELPDYIMVMVANRRTKSEMNEDLSLFLTTKTAAFVNWLHIVLKKLKEVTVTNPEVYKKAIKRKSSELPPDSKHDLKLKKEKSNSNKREESITDDLPLLLRNRKVVVSESLDDNFDIPLLAEVNASDNQAQLQDLEDRIRNVKSRLGLLVDSDHEDEALNIKAEDDPFSEQVEDENEINTMSKTRSINLSNDEENELEQDTEKRPQHTRITFEKNTKTVSVRSRLGSPKERFRDNSREKKKSILSRLGKRMGSSEYRSRYRQRSSSRDRDSKRSRHRRETSRERQKHRSTTPEVSKMRDGIIGRIQSKVRVVKASKPNITEHEEEEKQVAVPSLIKVKPRVIPRKAQPNKNLLMKAIADAQRSIAQTPKVGSNQNSATADKKEELMTKKYLEKHCDEQIVSREDRKYIEKRNPDKFRQNVLKASSKMRSHVSETSDEDDYNSDREYIPKPVKQTESDVPSYVPSSKNNSESDSENIHLSPETNKQQFIITLDGIDNEMALLDKKLSLPIKSRLEKKRSPSPIFFDKPKTTEIKTTRPDIPDKLPVVRQLALKNKERCRYWPGCRQGNKCEFVHPSETCKTFPQCKFGNKCLFLHPVCKFGSSCTKRDCTYDHTKTTSSKLVLGPLSSAMQTCKFFPNCVNAHCPFLHPKPCKYGKYCKNTDCSFSHGFTKNLSWRSK
ncbi:unnamed protein product [Ceutorhynchus assimilis]|uniref:Zinc finger CCCH domain-containing protein 14 n=1 Tax=Ceutorhynchus assimilis TaxID=467358 RepID=A0A9N9QAE6_9CUCU|nr:unnamed protein product [Ceutorhynchus assimilis]